MSSPASIVHSRDRLTLAINAAFDSILSLPVWLIFCCVGRWLQWNRTDCMAPCRWLSLSAMPRSEYLIAHRAVRRPRALVDPTNSRTRPACNRRAASGPRSSPASPGASFSRFDCLILSIDWRIKICEGVVVFKIGRPLIALHCIRALYAQMSAVEPPIAAPASPGTGASDAKAIDTAPMDLDPTEILPRDLQRLVGGYALRRVWQAADNNFWQGADNNFPRLRSIPMADRQRWALTALLSYKTCWVSTETIIEELDTTYATPNPAQHLTRAEMEEALTSLEKDGSAKSAVVPI